MKKYEELYRRIRANVESGALRVGERLPSVREQAVAAGLSVNTVVAAYALLADEGLVRIRDRGGYYVRGGDLAGKARSGARSEDLGEGFIAAAREAGLRLDQVYERLIRIDPSFACAAPASDILPLEALKKALGVNPSAWADYADPEGDAQLRRRIARLSEDLDGPTEEQDIVITTGATEALTLVLRALVKNGDTVVLEAPTYFNYFRQLAPLGVRILEIPVGENGMDLDALERELAGRNVRAIIVQPNVQNPTGTTMSDAAKSRLAALAERSGTLLIQDDVYGDLHFGSLRPRNLSWFSSYEGIVLISSYSKSLAPGLRIGWIRSPAYAPLLGEEKLRASMDSCRIAQAALASFVGSSAHRRHLAGIRPALEGRIDAHLAFLAERLPPGCSIQRPSGGCLLWLSLPEGTDATELFEKSARRGLIAAPGELFSSSGRFANHLRINAGMALTAERRACLEIPVRLLGDLPRRS